MVNLNCMKNISLLLLFFGLVCSVMAQPFPGGNIDVIVNGAVLKNPWVGGLDLPQFSPIDINQDGKDDIAIFDKKANKFLMFLGDGNANFKHAPQYDAIFPEVINTAFFRDYNCDGLADIFTNADGLSGFKVYQQYIDTNGIPQFELVKSILTYEQNGFNINIAKYNEDIAAIEDIDGDGDLDILVMDFSFGSTVVWYKNLSVESGFGCDSLIFEEETFCWGNFRESFINSDVELDFCCEGGCKPIMHNSTPRHIGTTLTAIDPDEDGTFDLLIGDIDASIITYLSNGGSSTSANMVAKDTIFPSYNTTVSIPAFPAGYYLDVTGDGKKDLLFAPNSKTTHLNTNNVHLYENTGDSSNRFNFVQNDFLVSQMIDFGSFGHATFFDHNGDGLLDLIVSNGFKYLNVGNSEGSMYYYENTGTAENPEFTFITDNYAGVKNLGLEFIRPTFGDIDGDGDLDMIIGDINGYIHLFLNTAGAGNTANFTLSQLQYKGIDVGSFCHPFLVDLDENGLLDLVIGRAESKGEVMYFKNIGTASVADFSSTPTNEALGNIDVSEPGWLLGFSSPFVSEPDSSGNRYLYSGSDIGNIFIYLINTDSLESGSFELISDQLLEVKSGIRTTITLVDINNDGATDYFMGNSRGGVNFYSDVITDSTIVFVDSTVVNAISYMEVLNFNMYPNPANNLLTIETENEGKYDIQIFDLLGKIIVKQSFIGGSTTINVSNLPKGLYVVNLKYKNYSKHKKLILE